MHIAMLVSTPFPPEEGISNYVHNLSNELAKQGHKVIIITRGGLRAQVLEFDKFVVFKLPFLMAYPFHVDIHGLFVERFIEHTQNLEILHMHTPLPPSLRNMKTTAGVVSTFHSTIYAGSGTLELVDFRAILGRILGILSKRIESGIIQHSDVLTVTSKSVAFELARCYNLESSDITVLGNAVGNAFFQQGRLPMDRERDTLLYVGRLDYGKGLFDLIDSLKLIVAKRPSSKLVFAGKGPLLRRLANRINTLGLRKNVEFQGFIAHSRLPFVYSRASLFVMPSYYEGMPTAVLEAMACGLPVVATAVHGNVDVVENGVTGILVRPKEPRELARAILHLLDHPTLRLELGRRAQRRAKEEFTWDKVAERALTAYNAARGGKPCGSP
jgi:glycosyltransferase involved in cell wall biosynthesis